MTHEAPQPTTWAAPRLRLMTSAARAEAGPSTYSVEYNNESVFYAPAS